MTGVTQKAKSVLGAPPIIHSITHIHTYTNTYIYKIYSYTHTYTCKGKNKNKQSNYLQTHTHTHKINYNQNKNCLSLCLKNVQGADNTSYETEFQRNTEFTKKEYR